MFLEDLALKTAHIKVVVFVKSPYKVSLHHRWPQQKQTIEDLRKDYAFSLRGLNTKGHFEV